MQVFNHRTVLLQEAVDGLNINPHGIYLDGTFGRGGHSRLILSKLASDGQLYAIDRDPRAIEEAQTITDPRFTILRGCFGEAPSLLAPYVARGQLSGLLLDLGVSSPQLDDPERGFSFMRDGPLDMRMDPEHGESAAEWLAHAEFDEIVRVLHDYGEERFARKIAAAICHDRETEPYTSTLALAEMIKRVVPVKEKNKHPATRTFQAIRIHINGELDEVASILESSESLLAPRGRLSVISFHSLEDRLVKNFIRRKERGVQPPRGLPIPEAEILKSRTFKAIGKAIEPSAKEIEVNPRSRSAVLRVAERVDYQC